MKPRAHVKINRIGEIHTTNEGHEVEIIDYFNANNLTIRFKDGDIINNVMYNTLTKGQVGKPKNRVGEVSIMTKGYTAEIVEYYSSSNCSIKFEDGTILNKIRYGEFKKGSIKNPYFPSVANIGYVGVGRYKIWVDKALTKNYVVWCTMINRVYNKKGLLKHKTYIGCAVDERWRNFQVFAQWFEQNYKSEYMQDWQLDKDILVRGNKIYSPETCCFVPREINSQFRAVIPKGVTKKDKMYYATISKWGSKNYLASFDNFKEASEFYIINRKRYIIELAEKYKKELSADCYNKLIKYGTDGE